KEVAGHREPHEARHAVGEEARAPEAAHTGGQAAVGVGADEALGGAYLFHHHVAGVGALGAADALELQAVSDVDAGGADLHAAQAVDAAPRVLHLLAADAVGLAALFVVGDGE